AEVGSMSFVRPHNDFLWIASEMGIPAFLLFISTIIWLVISGLKAISRNQNTALNLVVISTLMGLVITSMADFPMERQNHLVVFALAAAIGVYVNNKKAINLNPILGFIALFLSLAAVGFSLNVANNQFK